MNKKTMMMVGSIVFLGLVETSISMAADAPASTTTSQYPSTFPAHLDDQNKGAKYKLARAATNYLSSMEQYRLAVEAYLAFDIEKYARLCGTIRMLKHECSPSLANPEPGDHANRIDQAAAELAEAKVIFENEIRLIALQACKEVGYLCDTRQEDDIRKIFARLPPTSYDSDIATALDMLPHTEEIFWKITQKLASNPQAKAG